MEIRKAVSIADRAWLAKIWQAEWGGTTMVTRGQVHSLDAMEALIAWDDGKPVGAATYRIAVDGFELMSLNALSEGRGVGSALLAAVEEEAVWARAPRVWLITSNDNLEALRFYQRRGYHFTAVYPGAIDEARKVKPAIPLVGYHGIPIRDELELEKRM